MLTTIDWEKFHRILGTYLFMDDRMTLGFDEHLDLMLNVREDLRSLTRLIDTLAGEIGQHIPRFTYMLARDTVIVLIPCIRLTRNVVLEIRRALSLADAEAELEGLERAVGGLHEVVVELTRGHMQGARVMHNTLN
ncbi:hypothetical protein [Chitinophaga sp.]|uniref:hypothetical protein n=1 Tax=Chitinophaga sp. TaxID=1869181 RepID=UPI0026347B58|nr:hypothetical protein [uncultured Chitinophaga sp.]